MPFSKKLDNGSKMTCERNLARAETRNPLKPPHWAPHFLSAKPAPSISARSNKPTFYFLPPLKLPTIEFSEAFQKPNTPSPSSNPATSPKHRLKPRRKEGN
jgi:hypothetical protein